jgi:hypothetical protein
MISYLEQRSQVVGGMDAVEQLREGDVMEKVTVKDF